MRFQFNLKTLVLVVLIVAVALASYLAGASRARRATAVTTLPMTFTEVSKRSAASLPAVDQSVAQRIAQGLDPHGVASQGFKKQLTVTPGPGRVTVYAQAELVDKSGDKPYRWVLVIREKPSEKKVVDYQAPVFTVPRGQLREPEFKDTRELPPGDYEVELMISEVVGELSMEGPSSSAPVSVCLGRSLSGERRASARCLLALPGRPDSGLKPAARLPGQTLSRRDDRSERPSRRRSPPSRRH